MVFEFEGENAFHAQNVLVVRIAFDPRALFFNQRLGARRSHEGFAKYFSKSQLPSFDLPGFESQMFLNIV